MYLADYHTHSATSPDGQLTVSELAEAAVRAGLDEICVTDHVDTVLWGSHAPREHFDWSGLLAQVPQAREQYAGRLTIRLGAELGEAPMGFDRAEKLLARASIERVARLIGDEEAEGAVMNLLDEELGR